MAPDRPIVAPSWLGASLEQLERDERLDVAADWLRPIAEPLGRGSVGEMLRGSWLGHAFHPLMTDLPLGCWIGAGLLDVVGGRRSRAAAQHLVGLGLLFVPATVASGLADWEHTSDVRVRRVGVVHAAGNTLVALCYFRSWRARRANHHARGVAFGVAGGLLAWATGYLGGHMSFARGSSVEERGLASARAGVQSSAGSPSTL